MSDDHEDELDELSTHELHQRAFHRAERHLDVKFFWSLLEYIPVARVASGELGEADTDIQASRALIADALESDHRLGETLRPVYLDYLRRHPDA